MGRNLRDESGKPSAGTSMRRRARFRAVRRRAEGKIPHRCADFNAASAEGDPQFRVPGI
jgi:hypothetical protein